MFKRRRYAPKGVSTKHPIVVSPNGYRSAEIKYVDTYPGMGKTHWAIAELARRIDAVEGVTIYVGPTHALLQEVHDGILRKLGVRSMPKLILVDMNNGRLSDSTVGEALLGYLAGANRPRSEYMLSTNGTVVLCTHVAFSALPENFENRGNISVIFDEVRKCDVYRNSVPFRVPASMAERFAACFKTVKPLACNVPREMATFDSYFERIVDVDVRALSSMVRPEHMLKLEPMLRKVSEPRNESFLYFRKGGLWNCHIMVLPSYLFRGWREVYLMAAYLRTTQMWSMLFRRPVILDGKYGAMRLTAYEDGKPPRWMFQADLDRPVDDVYTGQPPDVLVNVTDKVVDRSRLDVIRARYKRTLIVYLTASRSMVSKRLLDGSVLVDADKAGPLAASFASVQTEARRRGMSMLSPRNAIANSSLANVSSHGDRSVYGDWVQQLQPSARRTPIEWMIWAANRVYTKFQERYNAEGQLLVLTNVAYQKYLDHYADTVRPLGFNPHGQNKYMDSDCVAYLAVTNPTPVDQMLYHDAIPWYDARQDYMIDNAVQAVTRSSIRNPKIKRPVLIVVTDKEVARLLAERFHGLPTVMSAEKFGIRPMDFVRFDTSDSRGRRSTEHKEAHVLRTKNWKAQNADRDVEHRNKYDAKRIANPYYKEIRRLEYHVRAARKNGLDTLGALQKELASVRALRDEWSREHDETSK